MRCLKQVGTLLSWVKPCTTDREPGEVEETIRIKEQPRNENDVEPQTTIAANWKRQTQLRPPDQVFVNVSGGPYQPKNFTELRKKQKETKNKNKKIISNSMVRTF